MPVYNLQRHGTTSGGWPPPKACQQLATDLTAAPAACNTAAPLAPPGGGSRAAGSRTRGTPAGEGTGGLVGQKQHTGWASCLATFPPVPSAYCSACCFSPGGAHARMLPPRAACPPASWCCPRAARRPGGRGAPRAACSPGPGATGDVRDMLLRPRVTRVLALVQRPRSLAPTSPAWR